MSRAISAHHCNCHQWHSEGPGATRPNRAGCSIPHVGQCGKARRQGKKARSFGIRRRPDSPVSSADGKMAARASVTGITIQPYCHSPHALAMSIRSWLLLPSGRTQCLTSFATGGADLSGRPLLAFRPGNPRCSAGGARTTHSLDTACWEMHQTKEFVARVRDVETASCSSFNHSHGAIKGQDATGSVVGAGAPTTSLRSCAPLGALEFPRPSGRRAWSNPAISGND